MNIQLLYFDGCPCWLETKQTIEDTLSERGLAAPIDLVNVESNEQAQELSFVGSPTVRVDGEDVGPETPTEGFNLECRIYWVEGRASGAPPREWIVEAVDKAAAGERRAPAP